MSDANKRADNDPSMDDILASIRKIISDDEARAQVAANQPGNSQSTPTQAAPAEVPASQVKPAVPARGARPNTNTTPVREDVLLLTDLIEEQEPKLGAAGPRPTGSAQPIPLPRIDPVRASEMPQPSVEPAPEVRPTRSSRGAGIVFGYLGLSSPVVPKVLAVVGLAPALVPDLASMAPNWLRPLAASSIAMGTVCAILLTRRG